MNSFTVILDSNVLYPAPVRDLLVQCASANLYRAKITDKINEEWMSNLLKNRKDLSREQLERTCLLLSIAMPDCMVQNYESLIESLTLPDPDDKHVLAAAIQAKAQAIITFNEKDFPESSLKKFNIEAIHPDRFLRLQADLFLARFLECVKNVRGRLKKPEISPEAYIVRLGELQLVQTASFLLDFVRLI